MRKPRFWKGVLSVGGIFMSLILVETAFRIFHVLNRNDLMKAFKSPLPKPGTVLRLIDIIHPSRNKKLIYELRPGVRGLYHGAEIYINTKGMRDDEIETTKHGRNVRIAVIGDSCVFGQGVGQSDTLSESLERFLNNQFDGLGVRYDVLNFGVPGYNTAMEAELFRTRVLSFSPDAAVLIYVGNDTQLPNFIEPETSWKDLEIVRFFRVFRDRLDGKRHVSHSGALIETTLKQRLESKTEVSSFPEPYRDMIGWAAVVRSLEDLANLGRQNSVPMVILCNSSGNDVKPYMKLSFEELRQLSNDVYRTAEGFGWIVANPVELQVRNLKETVEDLSIYWCKPGKDRHPSTVLHAIYALCVFRQLSQAKILPKWEVLPGQSVAEQIDHFVAHR